MPEGTPVDRCYQKLKEEGKSEASAAKICQSSTGTSLRTGKPPKHDKSIGSARCSKFLRSRGVCGCKGGCDGKST